MARRRKAARKTKAVNLTDQEMKVAADRMMASALAHGRASAWCRENPDAKLPSIDFFYFTVVSFELVLISLEQSLRLLLLLHYSIIRADTNHSPNVLYKGILNKSGSDEGNRVDIVDKANELGQNLGISSITEEELLACLRKHDSSYSNFRFFQLDHQGKLNPTLEVTPHDEQIVRCLASALIVLNMDEMRRQGIPMGSLREVPESEMTEELQALRKQLAH